MSLTGSDGAGLELVSYAATAVVQEPLAFTELHLVFRNPEPRVREGRFRIALPSGAAVSRFAMKMESGWQEGEVVEKQAARVAYEDALHRRQDPALLENEAGNEFAARVFPIPAQATKELIVSYAEELGASTQPYRLALRGLPRMEELEVRVLRGSKEGSGTTSNLGGTTLQQEVVTLSKTAFTPDRDFELPRASGAPVGLRRDEAVVVRFKPLGEVAQPSPLRALEVLIDTSASRALGFDDELARLRAVLHELCRGGDFPLTVSAFDQEVLPLWSGQASAYPTSVDDKLRARLALGASHLAGALAKVSGKPRVLLVTDGVATAGTTEGDELRAAVKKLAARGVERLDVLAVGGLRDDETLRRLVTAGLSRAGRVLLPEESPAAIAERLRRETSGDLAVNVEGATWSWPTHVQGLQGGDELVVYAEVPAQRPVRLTVGGKTPASWPASFVTAERPLLSRALAQARLARIAEQRDTLAAGDDDLRAALRHQMIELSVKNRVLCRDTALVVLETENDYARFGIDRRALADILTVTARGLEVVHRATPGLGPEPTVPAIAVAAPTTRTPVKSVVRRELRRKEAHPLDDLLEGAAKARPSAARTAATRDEPLAGLVGGSGHASSRAHPSRVAAKPAVVEDLLDGVAASEPAPMPAAPAPLVESAPLAAEEPMAVRARGESFDEEETALAAPAAAPAQLARAAAPEVSGAPAWQGTFARVMSLLARGAERAALDEARTWQTSAPGDVLALVALGEAFERNQQPAQAARAYGAIIDLFPGRADLRRYAGGHLERLQGKLGAAAIELAVDTFRKAAADRPDHPASHRLLAFALLKAGRAEEAFAALSAGLARSYPEGRFARARLILAEDLGLVAAVWTAQAPARAREIAERLAAAGGVREEKPSLRFVLTWETDANDVDFHIKDGRGGHAFYRQKELPSGGELYADVTTGYGPECFTVRNPEKARAYPYVLQAHYYSRGPMGYGMGKLQILDHDGKGHLRFHDRPFVVMNDNAFVNLGRYDGRE